MVCPDKEERTFIFFSLSERFAHLGDMKKGETLEEALIHLNSTSLLNERVVAAFESSAPTQKEIEQLEHYIKHPNPHGHLLLAVGKLPSQIYNQGKKDIILIDLTMEKPWDQKDRIKKWAFRKIAAANKRITPDALDALFERLPPERFLLEKEIDKLFCFIDEKDQITRDDVTAICCDLLEKNLFQLADEIVWGKLTDIPLQKDLAQLLPLIGILRNSYEMGLKMGVFLQRGVSSQEIAKHFSKLRPRVLEKRLQIVRRKGETHFSRGLKQLFELELGLKTSFGPPELLFARFCTKAL